MKIRKKIKCRFRFITNLPSNCEPVRILRSKIWRMDYVVRNMRCKSALDSGLFKRRDNVDVAKLRKELHLMYEKMEKEFEVWSEGWCSSGGVTGATFHGKFKGDTFKDAVIAWKNQLTDEYSIKCVDVDRMVFWGCKLFDNEKDARKFMG